MEPESVTKKQIIPEAHAYLLEQLRLLERQDPTFKHLAYVIAHRLRLMVGKGGKYNRPGNGVLEGTYYRGDQSAFFNSHRYDFRLMTLTDDNRRFYSDEEILELIQDPANYHDMWLCCREAHKHSGTEKV